MSGASTEKWWKRNEPVAYHPRPSRSAWIEGAELVIGLVALILTAVLLPFCHAFIVVWAHIFPGPCSYAQGKCGQCSECRMHRWLYGTR